MVVEIKPNTGYPKEQWVLMIDGIEKPIIFRSFDINSAGEWCKRHIKNNFLYSIDEIPNWRCTTKENFKEKKWIFGKLDGKWYRATDFTKSINTNSKVSFKSNKQRKSIKENELRELYC